jgi:hypothetical protein
MMPVAELRCDHEQDGGNDCWYVKGGEMSVAMCF